MKVAAFLLSINNDASSKLLKSISNDQEVAALVKDISLVNSLTEDEQVEVLAEISEVVDLQSKIASGGLDVAQNLLVEAYGEEGANNILHKMANTIQRVPFEFLRLIDSEQIANTIQNENIQVISLVLSYLKVDKAAQVIQNLPEGIRSEASIRMAKMDRTNPEVLTEVERVLERRFAALMAQSDIGSDVGGADFLAEVLNRVDRTTEKRIIEDLEIVDQVLATEIKNLMFVFEDINRLDDKSIQRLLRDIETKDLSLALKGASEEIRTLFFANMAERAGKILKDDIEMMGPVRMKDVNEVQTKIVGIVRSLEQAGEIMIFGGGDDDAMIE